MTPSFHGSENNEKSISPDLLELTTGLRPLLADVVYVCKRHYGNDDEEEEGDLAGLPVLKALGSHRYSGLH